MADSSVRVPEISPIVAGREVDCETLERDGVIYYRQRVIVEELAGGVGTATVDTSLVLGKILKELRLMNMQLASMTGERLTTNDTGD